VTGFLRRLEKIFVGWLDEVALEPGFRAQSRENATGVWIEKPNAASLEAAKKIASIGIAVKKWVTYHGIAINIVNDLSPFRLISPCGFSPDVMTSLETLLGAAAFNRKYGQDSWRSKIETELAQRFYSCDTGAEREVETDAEIDTGRDLGRNPGRDLKIQEVWV
jgi:lipoyl(octanoyl) transferase